MANENDFLKALNSLRKKQGHSEIKAQSLQEKARSAEYNRKKLAQGLKGGTVDTIVINANLNKGAGYGAEQQKALAKAKTSKWVTPEATKMMDNISNKITSTQNQITEQGERAIKDYVAKVNKEREELENQYSDLNKWDRVTGNVLENIGRAAPKVVASALVPGGAFGAASKGVSAALKSIVPFAQTQASTVADEVSQGRSVKEAHKIGQTQGMMDALTDRLSGGVLGLENSGVSRAVTKALGGGKLANRVASSLGEGIEEAASTFMQPVTKAFVTGEEYTPASKQDIANSFVNAAAMSTLFGLGQDAMNAAMRERANTDTFHRQRSALEGLEDTVQSDEPFINAIQRARDANNVKQYGSVEQMRQSFLGKPVEQNANTDYTNNTDTNGGSADGLQNENGRGILSGAGGVVQPRGNGRESGSGENPVGASGPVRASDDAQRLQQNRGGSGGLHASGLTPRVNTDTAIRDALTKGGHAVFDMRNTDDGVSFFNAITQAKKENQHGAYVTAYDANDYTGFRTMLDDTGKAGVAVKPDGDIISVFSNPTSGRKKAVSTLLINALDAGGTKLDNFDGNLSQKYEQHGFIPVARVAFDREYAPDGWNYERDGTPDVIFWIHNGDTPEQVAQKVNTYEHYDTSKLPLFSDYDSAQAYRDGLLEKSRPDDRTGPQGESRTARRFVNGETTLNIPEGMQSALNEVVESQNTYRKTSIQGARDLADKTIKERGIDGAYTEFLRNLNAKKAKKAENHVLGARLVEAYANLGDMERAADVLKAMRDTSTESAQLLALNKVLYEQGGTGMLMQIQRDVDAINKEYGTDIKIKDDLMQKLNAAEGKEQIESVAEEIYNDVAPQVPVKKGEKLDAWRRLAMLANPKTQVRNLLGNAGVKGMRDISGVMDGILQTVFIRDPSKRTNSFLVSHKPGFKEAKNWATDYFAQNESVISDGTRYEGPKNKILENRQIFKSRPMRAAEKGTNWAMGKGDTIFLRNRFARSVAEEAATRGVTVADLESNAKLRNEIVSRAIKEAQEQTFHDSSALATSINKTVRKLEKSDNPLNKALAVGIKGFMPFTKTPVNIAKRAVDYSPLGFVKTIYNGLHDASPVRAANTINSLSKNLTGSALAGLGYMMAESGMLRVGEDDKQEYTDSDQGRQRYSLEIGGTSISLDWLAPTSIPLFFGATLSQAGNANSVKDVESLAQTFFGPMLDMSMMSSVDDAVTEIRKADTNISGVVSALLYTPFESYALQYLPTMGSQLNQTIDPTRRTTQTMSDGLLGKVEKTGRKALNKLPGANRLLEALGMDNAANQPYVDMWGNKQTNTRGTFNDNVGWRALQAFVMPSYINQVKDDPVYDEMKRLYNAGENGSEQMLPSNFGDEVKNGGTTYPVRGTDSTNYKTQKGQTQYNLLRGLMNTDAYRSASDAERIKMVQDAYKYAEYKADKQYLNNKGKDYTYSTSESTGRISDWQYKVECLEQSGISPETYFGAHRSYKNAEGEHYVDKWGETKTTSGTKRIAQVEALKGHGMTAAQKLLFMYMEQPSTRFNAKYVGISNDQARRVVFSYVNDLNLSREEKEKILKRAGYYITDRGITWK